MKGDCPHTTMAYVVGLMSGTSLDGVDAALVEINGVGEQTHVRLMAYHQEEMPEDLKNEIKAAIDPMTSRIDLVCSLNFKLGYWFSEGVKRLCAKAAFPLEKLDLIGSHGQTIYHIPKDSFNLNDGGGYIDQHHPHQQTDHSTHQNNQQTSRRINCQSEPSLIRSTLQLGEPAVIAYETGTPVVSNFRSMDIAAGGEGAPLVPYVDYLLYRSRHHRALQNIGGIGNVTVVPAQATIEEVSGSDTGPGNMIIDELCLRLKGEFYDKDGYYAASGKVHEPLLNDLLQHPFILAAPPKTTGREMFGKRFVDDLLQKWAHRLSENDLIATATQFTASSIIQYYQKFIFPSYPIKEVIVSGGGSYNPTLFNMLKKGLPQCQVLTQEDLGYSSAAKEAIAFAVLAHESWHGQFGNAPKATGAKRRVVLGQITNP